MADLWGYWSKNPRYAHSITWAVAVLVVASILSGFFIIGTPMHARQTRMDDQRISDLQGVQSQVVSFYQSKQKLPGSLGDLNDPLSYYSVPTDPAGGQYEYKPDGALSFSLCATFGAEGSTYGPYAAQMYPNRDVSGDNWSHGAGYQCFERTIDPQLYPPLNK
jgi:hypothetical protein